MDNQKPIQMPRLHNKFDSKMSFEKMPQWEKGRMLRVKMIMNDAGCIFWLLHYKEGNLTKVIMHEPAHEMGQANFFKEVYSFRSSCAYFFLIDPNGQFCIMDEKKTIKVLT